MIRAIAPGADGGRCLPTEIAAIVPATFLPANYAEPFAIATYAAAFAAAFGVAMECRRLRS